MKELTIEERLQILEQQQFLSTFLLLEQNRKLEAQIKTAENSYTPIVIIPE